MVGVGLVGMRLWLPPFLLEDYTLLLELIFCLEIT
jgi:hypothetical protein